MSDRDSVGTNALDYRTQRLWGHLSLVGLLLEDRVPARERLVAEIGDLAPFCLVQAADQLPAQADGEERDRAS